LIVRLVVALFAAMMVTTAAAQTVVLFAAGSLRVPLSEAARSFGGARIEPTFGASGLLRDRIAGGAQADVFASANMEHPQALVAAGWSDRVQPFARNRMCVLARSDSAPDSAQVLDALLDPARKVGTSRPKADPSGDYAWEVFKRADALRPGAYATLTTKAMQLTGGPASPPPPPDRSVYAMLVANRTVDLFLTYCTNARAALREDATLRRVELPRMLEVSATCGIAVRKDAPASARAFAGYLLSPEGQAVLTRFGFAPP
jgi:ABC-type molybdate transport system substrate-binding protein